ncbi:Coatomer epsilon subunit [Asanoa hainanensis]|uniref:Coatomer epsilon subunit n=1 Tax=Asanoa hainanensis TaxID=560556 RepID=A0A239NZU8_9ACTN|nr:tetratricopeptide repeat protein [Asanoa hainanensis]SNT60365.1 Coatomer epsilon subunit [Asanoa hainanensis]
MTTFSTVIDKDPIVGGLRGPDLPAFPRIISHPSSHTKSSFRKSRSISDEDVDELAIEWYRAAKVALWKAVEAAERSPTSMTSNAHVADLAALADEADIAVESALKVLRLGQSRIQGSTASSLDIPSAYHALQVLIRMGKADAAEEHFQSWDVSPVLAVAWASVLVKQSRLDEALQLLAIVDQSQPGVNGLQGYVFVLQKKYDKALRQLRAANRIDPNDVDAALNMAVAMFHSGSPQKAVNWARYAARLSPGSHGATMALVHYLIETKSFGAAEAQVRHLKEHYGLVDTPHFVYLQVRLAAARSDRPRVSTLLRRARGLALASGNDLSVMEIDGHIAVYDYLQKRITRVEAQGRLRRLMKKAPTSLVLLNLLTDIVTRNSEAAEIRRRFDGIDKTEDDDVAKAISTRLAYLEGRFDDAVNTAAEWISLDPAADFPLVFWTLTHGALTEDWNTSAEAALTRLRRQKESTDDLLNSAAYALSLAGRGSEAVTVLNGVSDWDFRLKATSGLAYLAAGNVRRGLQLYRDAADLADQEDPELHLRCLMTLHQAMAIRRLGLLDGPHASEVLAGALPEVELPTIWTDTPELRFLAEVARRRGWEWPCMVR